MLQYARYETLLNVAELEQFNNGSILFTQVATCLANASFNIKC